MLMGRIAAICRSGRRGTKKQAVSSAELVENSGIAGDAHAGTGHRQVSLLAVSAIEHMRTQGLSDIHPGDFGENLIVFDIDLATLGLGSRLRIGNDAEIIITQRGKVCHSRCAIFNQTGDCIMPREGIFARVIRGGLVMVGDAIDIAQVVPPDMFQAVILTISDKGSRGERADTAGPAVAQLLQQHLRVHIYGREILPDDRQRIADRLRHYADGHSIDLVVTVGGTGFAPRDVTPEAVRDVAERLTPGLDEAMRATSLRQTPHAILSRAASGIRGQTLLLSLPGSERAAVENLQAILPALPHGLGKLRGDTADCGNPSSSKDP
jgi:molybdopterin adenylyltransferase